MCARLPWEKTAEARHQHTRIEGYECDFWTSFHPPLLIMLPTPMKHVGSQGKKERESSRLPSTPFSYATYQSIESQLIFFLAPRRCKAGAGSFLVSGETSSPGYFNNEWLFKQYNQNPYASPPQKKCMARKVIRKRKKKKKRKLLDLSGQQLCHIQHSNK